MQCMHGMGGHKHKGGGREGTFVSRLACLEGRKWPQYAQLRKAGGSQSPGGGVLPACHPTPARPGPRGPGGADTCRVTGLLGVRERKLAVIFLAPALGFPELFTLLVVTQVEHLLNVFLVFHLGESWR